jgi:EmrB/QacA subfamily drug resistance transporter
MTPSRFRATVAVTGAALFMIVLDNLIVVSTLPSIERSLDASLATLEWVVDAYILAFAVLILTGAALGERFGRRRIFTAGLLVFSGASAAGALSPTAEALVAARVVQGAAAAVLMPLTLTLLTMAVPAERRTTALGLWSAIAGIGVAAGPIAGGLLTSALSWHWIFWVNVPVGIAAAWVTPRILEESRGKRVPLDFAGLALASAGLLGVVWATVRGNLAGWGGPQTLGAYGTGAALLAAFFAHQAAARHPMLPLRLLRARATLAANAGGFLLHFAMFGTFFIVIQFLAQVRHLDPVAAGLWTLPWTAMPLLVSPLAGALGRRVAPAVPFAAGMALATTGIAAIGLVLDPATPPVALAPGLLAIGVGIGLVLPSLATIAVSGIDPADVGRASGTLATARQLGSVFGVAVAVAIAGLDGAPRGVAGTVSGMGAALATTAVAGVLGVAVALTLVERVSQRLGLSPAPA